MNVIHIAWLGHQNYGDDIMAMAIRKYLSQKLPVINYTIWCDGRPREEQNIRWIYPFRLPHQLKKFFEDRALKKTDLLLIGGGSILHSANSSKWKLRGVEFLRKNVPKAKAVGINLSVGPFKTVDDEKKCKLLLQSLDVASFRDKNSYDFALRCNLPYRPLLTFDLAGSFLKLFNIEEKESNSEINCIGISLKRPDACNESIVKQYVDLLRTLSTKYKKIKIFSFCSSKAFGDQDFLDQFPEITELDNVEIVNYSGDPVSFTYALQECDFFISTRLHSMILAFLMNIPFIALSYHKKCDDLVDLVGLPKKYCFSDMDFSVESVVDNVQIYSLPDRERFVSTSFDNFKVFDNVSFEKIKEG